MTGRASTPSSPQRLGRLPPRVQRRLSGRPPIVIDGQRLEADVQLMLALRELPRRAGLGRAR